MGGEFWKPHLEDDAQCSGFSLTLHREQKEPARFSVSKTHLQQAVLARIQVVSACHPDGMVYPCPVGIEDEVLDILIKENLLIGVAIDDLVVASFKLLMNDDADSATTQLLRLKDRLASAISAVDDHLRGMELDRSARLELS